MSLNQVVKGISGIVEKILQIEVVKTDYNFNDGDFSKKHSRIQIRSATRP